MIHPNLYWYWTKESIAESYDGSGQKSALKRLSGGGIDPLSSLGLESSLETFVQILYGRHA